MNPMRENAIRLEEARLQDVNEIDDYGSVHERHRVFPAVFENRQHKVILDTSAGVGCVAQRIWGHYSNELLCNDITPKCLTLLQNMGLPTVSFDLDSDEPYPFPDGHFDAIVSLSTIEHLIHVDHFVKEIHRILSKDGRLYISSPNYASVSFFPQYVLPGRSFHNPLSRSVRQRYEFYAHVRYFTYSTLLEFVSAFGFVPDTVYLPLPAGSTQYQALYAKSKLKALAFRNPMRVIYTALSPRWAPEPVLCFRKADSGVHRKMRKVLL